MNFMKKMSSQVVTGTDKAKWRTAVNESVSEDVAWRSEINTRLDALDNELMVLMTTFDGIDAKLAVVSETIDERVAPALDAHDAQRTAISLSNHQCTYLAQLPDLIADCNAVIAEYKLFKNPPPPETDDPYALLLGATPDLI
ncbi:uncharacterized protein AMSG_08659 [Thecamonas trahens ATCC 50062]|uniref:Uncharacterized protein n=1 Tax=Thecamonas trahens ATCC 50062 TaxID=461836 RepID=A0A0L0DKL3_THETB|nr:hypothetical protein AMSG_08659 [Thecamonas trahens ATCC 50062]KNC52775.1 hypothetical protein AMSG_08659 [Thecamonas trahens ATCC 50062]|eukprot:XP_013755087.1 hypothetical protein AMSG_08659 [Thecamonas trahens ATCC 50062]